ncbi:MAG: hypothetical protein EBS51_09865 [Planctomycetia bacterium]|nr:hypothetical protein [Planctomycetia bacterium]
MGARLPSRRSVSSSRRARAAWNRSADVAACSSSARVGSAANSSGISLKAAASRPATGTVRRPIACTTAAAQSAP